MTHDSKNIFKKTRLFYNCYIKTEILIFLQEEIKVNMMSLFEKGIFSFNIINFNDSNDHWKTFF